LLVTFLTAHDLRQVAAGEMPDLDRNISVFVSRASETSPVSEAAFARIKQNVRNNANRMARRSDEILSSPEKQDLLKGVTGEPSAGAHAEGTVNLGIFDEQPNSISSTLVTTLRAQAKGQEATLRQTASITTALVHGRMLFISVGSVDATAASVAWTQATTRELLKSIAAANP
jgi:hypothetical protein